MTFIGIRSGPVALFGFNFLTILLISSVVASGNSKKVLFMPSSLIWLYLDSLYIYLLYQELLIYLNLGFLDYLCNLVQVQKFSLQYLYSD